MTTMDTGTDMLLVEVVDGIATVTFNNPEKLNAMSRAMREALAPTLEALAGDDSVRVVVATGAGDRAFVSGADISEFGEQRTSTDARAAYDAEGARTARAWKSLGKPIIAMIRGYCIGGGLLTALEADIRIASDDSQFAIPAARLGLGYGYGGVKTLVDVVGPSWAAEILFSARRLSADEALRIGLVNRIVSVSQLRDQVWELAHSIAANAPLTVAACKASIGQALLDPDRRELGSIAEMIEACFASDDYREGQTAFMEKRPPRFRGR